MGVECVAYVEHVFGFVPDGEGVGCVAWGVEDLEACVDGGRFG